MADPNRSNRKMMNTCTTNDNFLRTNAVIDPLKAKAEVPKNKAAGFTPRRSERFRKSLFTLLPSGDVVHTPKLELANRMVETPKPSAKAPKSVVERSLWAYQELPESPSKRVRKIQTNARGPSMTASHASETPKGGKAQRPKSTTVEYSGATRANISRKASRALELGEVIMRKLTNASTQTERAVTESVGIQSDPILTVSVETGTVLADPDEAIPDTEYYFLSPDVQLALDIGCYVLSKYVPAEIVDPNPDHILHEAFSTDQTAVGDPQQLGIEDVKTKTRSQAESNEEAIPCVKPVPVIDTGIVIQLNHNDTALGPATPSEPESSDADEGLRDDLSGPAESTLVRELLTFDYTVLGGELRVETNVEDSLEAYGTINHVELAELTVTGREANGISNAGAETEICKPVNPVHPDFYGASAEEEMNKYWKDFEQRERVNHS